jgi:hypothetical protein
VAVVRDGVLMYLSLPEHSGPYGDRVWPRPLLQQVDLRSADLLVLGEWGVWRGWGHRGRLAPG